jgi:hypothetical protein
LTKDSQTLLPKTVDKKLKQKYIWKLPPTVLSMSEEWIRLRDCNM